MMNSANANWTHISEDLFKLLTQSRSIISLRCRSVSSQIPLSVDFYKPLEHEDSVQQEDQEKGNREAANSSLYFLFHCQVTIYVEKVTL